MYNVQRCSNNIFNALYDITGFASWDGATHSLLLCLFKVAWIQVECAATAAYGWRGELVSHERQAPPNGRLMS